MKKGFTTFLSALKANTPPCKKGLSSLRFLSIFLILFLAVGNAWAADPVENVGTYSTQVISADGTTSTWTFITPGSQVTIPTSPAETEDNDIIFHPGGSSKMKFSSSNGLSWSGNSDGYIYVPAGAAGSISMTVKSTSDSRWLQLYVDGVDQGATKRLWSKEANPATAARGPRTFTFTSSDLTTKGEKTYLHLKDNNTEMKIATFTVTLTTGTYLTPSCSTEITTQPSGATLAIDDANPELSIVATNVASYAWKESSDGTSYDGASSLGSSASFTPSVNDVVQTKYYYCEVTSSCDGAAVVKSNIVTINVVGAISYYTVTLNPAGGTIVDATGWTLNAGNYEKEVAEGTVLTLPTFTKTDRAFKTWRKAGPADVASPVTVDGDLSLTAIWTATIEQVIYSWEGAEGGAIETGGTAAGSVDGLINIAKSGYYCLQINGNTSYDKYVEITLSGEEKVKTGDKIRYTGFYTNTGTKNAAVKMRVSGGTAIFTGANLPRIEETSPRTDTYTVPEGINAAAIQITRHQTQTNSYLTKLQIIREVQVEEGDLLTVTFDANGGSAIAPVVVASGQAVAKPADPTWEHHRFDGWYNGSDPYNWSDNVTGDLTLTANWTQLYTISFAAGEGGSGDAPAAIADKAAGETFTVPANTFTAPTGYVFDHWNDGTNDYDPEETYMVGTNNITLTAVWRTPSTMYEITKGAHENGDFTIAPASQEAGEIVTLEATPNEDYLFSAWEVVKTEDASTTGITVDANGQFTMPAYAVTVNAKFVADTRAKVLYVTNNNETITKASDKLYEALKDDYRVTIVDPASTETVTNYALVVLHESVGGSNYNAAAVAAAKGGSVPVLNTKSYFYNDGRWNWGTPNAGKTIKGATLNSAYCNIASHPLFDGLTITDGFFEITDEAAAKCMQPIGSFVAGKEGYTLATTPNNDSGEGCAIHELTPEQRDASAGKYLMISVSNDKLNALNANGQKLFQNAAAYLIGSTSWTPVAVPTSPVVAATPTENYTEGGTITLTASAEGTSASTVYTWYKGADWATASATTPVQAALTSGATFSKTAAVEDAGTYWCNISNGTSCDVQASVTITVSSASTPTHTISYDNVKGADMTAYPTEYTEGIGVASFDPLADITGWHFVEWNPASIATDATTDQTITAVWAQVFEVTFNYQGHGAENAKQDIISGEKVTEPTAPSAIGYDFGGWFTDEECTAGNEFDFNTPITAATPLYAKWTEFEGCVLLVPETSGDAPAVGDPISMQTGSKGGSMSVVGTPLSYSEYGLGFDSNASAKAKVTINNEIQEGTVISLTLVANGTSARGLHLYTGDGSSKVETLGWTSDVVKYTEATFTYTVKATDVALIGSNEFQLWRKNSVFLKQLTVTNCGAAITYHNLTSEVNIADKGTVTLGATSVREGYTTTATYSEIDPAYEFVNWTVSGEGASVENATANPAIITVGTGDAVVKLNLQVKPVYYTVTYYDGITEMGTEQVAENGHPSATGIITKKLGYNFLGWSETDGDAVVNLNDISITAAKNLYAKYEAVVCPTTGTVYKFEIKDELSSENLPTSTDKDMSSYINATGDAYLTYTATANNKATINSDGTIQLKDATAAYLKVELECALAAGDQIRAHVTNNPIRVQVGTTYESSNDLILAKNVYEFVGITSAMEGKQILYITRSTNGNANLADFEIYRPAKYTVTFDMMGHGSAIADITNVIEGSKISAPTAPTDAAYSFAGWYKESTLENEWDFDVDVVEANTTLYAKWLDKSDATLKSLKYGSTEIELQAGVYTYAVELPSLTTSVPALTAETNNPSATKVIADAAAFDSEGNATSTVTITPEVGADQVYTVNFTKLPSMPLLDVDNSIVWDFGNAGTQNNDFTDEVLANFPGVTNDATFRAQTLKASGAKIEGGYLQGSPILFHATKDGLLRVEFSNTGSKTRPYRYLVVNGVRTAYKSNNTTHVTTAWIEVPAGDVTIEGECVEDANGACTSDNLNFYKIEFLAVGYTRDNLNPTNIATICLPNGGIMTGATLYKMAGKNEYNKLCFDEVQDNIMVAGNPYLFVPENGNIKINVYYTDEHNADAGNDNGLYGTYERLSTVDDGQNSLLWGKYIISNNKYIYVDANNCNLAANRAYIVLNEVQPVKEQNPAPGLRRIVLGTNESQVATGVDQVQGDEVPTKMIINGQLFILRGEKMYDAQGKLVK